MADHFGGSDAEGRWSVRDAHAALELAQVLFLAQATEFSPAMSSSFADEAFNRRLADLSDAEREALEIDLSPREYV